jgi:hypothetical protein
MKTNPTSASDNLKELVLALSDTGCKPEEIAARILNTEAETVLFRVKSLVEIIILGEHHRLDDSRSDNNDFHLMDRPDGLAVGKTFCRISPGVS